MVGIGSMGVSMRVRGCEGTSVLGYEGMSTRGMNEYEGMIRGYEYEGMIRGYEGTNHHIYGNALLSHAHVGRDG